MRLKVVVCIVAGAFVASAQAITGIHPRGIATVRQGSASGKLQRTRRGIPLLSGKDHQEEI
jgi:hypothetical protein